MKNFYNDLDVKIFIFFRRERGNCRICWSTSALTDFVISGNLFGKVIPCCGYGGGNGKGTNFDCVQIPSASKKSNNAILPVAGFCGQQGLISESGNTLATVCCKF